MTKPFVLFGAWLHGHTGSIGRHYVIAAGGSYCVVTWIREHGAALQEPLDQVGMNGRHG